MTTNLEIDGPYSFKGADGHKTPIYIFKPGGEKKIIGETTVSVAGGMTFDVQLEDEYKDIETGSFEVPMRYTFFNRPAEPPINWGFNCLTMGVHHGRPEALWRLPLLQATQMFSAEELKDLVVYRIYTDALIFVHRGDEPRMSKEWAEKTKEIAEARYFNALQVKVGEISNYYKSASWHRDVEGVVERVKNNRLNPHYEPLHGHDSINMLCRILGQPASIQANKEVKA